MARLLVLAKAGDRQGEVITVQPDDHKWGAKEIAPTFAYVDLPGVPVEKLVDLIEPDLVFNPDSGKLDFRNRRKVVIDDVDGAKSATTETELRAKTRQVL